MVLPSPSSPPFSQGKKKQRTSEKSLLLFGALSEPDEHSLELKDLESLLKRQPHGLGWGRSSIKVNPKPCSLIHFSCLTLLGNQVLLQPQDMSCYNQCLPCLPCQPCGPTPLANSCNEPCVRQCQDSTVVIEPPPVVVTLPGPILSSFPQSTAVGSSTSAAVGSILSSEGVPISSGGFGLSGFGSRYCGRPCLPC
ncbi:feather beta keratin-like [Gavia stellata]|uniref:feather beta keratin-like n=1 Tax=Gavia stellata TaxID=37040 RepID=UPI0028A225A7|nr:feather beta keratin-like [Gavia stellata]